MSRTVRDATFEVFRRRGLTTLFSNPGSTEVPFLAGLPDDLRFVLALHEGSVLGLATGYALGRGEPALVLVHTTAGLGNSVGGIATARVNRAPLVIIVGQQDRRHLVFEPFLAGRLSGLAGEYPVWVDQPVRRAGRARRDRPRLPRSRARRAGPAIVVVPMDDWLQEADAEREDASAGRVLRARAVDDAAVDELAAFLESGRSPALVVGAGADEPETWEALVELAERLVAPVFQESFGARAGFPQDHRLFAGFLPADRPRLRERLAPYDAVLVARRGRVPPVAVDARPLHRGRHAASRSSATTRPRCTAARSSSRCSRRPQRRLGRSPPGCRSGTPSRRSRSGPPPPPAPPAPGEPLTASHVLAALAERLPEDAVVVEEAPVDRPEIHDRLLARRPLGFVSAAMGGLGFGVPGAAGLRMALPDRPVVAVIGDGSSLYGIQGLWSAAHYRAGVLYVILSNGGYAIMDRLAERSGQRRPVARLRRDRDRRARARLRLPGAARDDARRAAGRARRGDADACRARGAAAPRRRDRADDDVRAVTEGGRRAAPSFRSGLARAT